MSNERKTMHAIYANCQMAKHVKMKAIVAKIPLFLCVAGNVEYELLLLTTSSTKLNNGVHAISK